MCCSYCDARQRTDRRAASNLLHREEVLSVLDGVSPSGIGGNALYWACLRLLVRKRRGRSGDAESRVALHGVLVLSLNGGERDEGDGAWCRGQVFGGQGRKGCEASAATGVGINIPGIACKIELAGGEGVGGRWWWEGGRDRWWFIREKGCRRAVVAWLPWLAATSVFE